MKWLFALLGLFVVGVAPAPAQRLSQADSITQHLIEDLRPGTLAPMVRVVLVREQLAAGLRRDQVRQVPMLLDYLTRSTPDSVVRFQPHEKWALLAAAGEFAELLKRVAADQWYYTGGQERPRLRPPQDGLFEATQAYLARHADALRAQARQSRFLPEDSTFLQLGIQVLALQQRNVPQALTADLLAFVGRFPQLEYRYFLGSFIRPEYVPSRFSYGLDFHTGTAVFTGGLNKAFRPGFNLGHGFEFGWDRYMLYLRNYIGFAYVREPYHYDGRTWDGGQRLNYYVPEISIGYRLVDNKCLRLSPFVGISWCSFSPPPALVKNNPGINFDVNMRGPLTAGLNLDVLLWKTQSGAEVGSWMLKLRSGVRAAEASLNPATKGALFYLDVGIGGFGRMLRPQKPGSSSR